MNPQAKISPEESNTGVATSPQETDLALSMRLTYQIKHGFLKWSIENFSFFPSVNDKYCLSPIFKLNETWWYIAIHPKAKICGQDKISLNLFRHTSDLGPQKVTVSYRLGLECYGNKVWFKPEEAVIFRKGDSYGFQTAILGHLEDFLAEGVNYNNDTLSVLCEMYIVYTLTVKTEPSNPQKLSIDLDLPLDTLKLFTTRKLNDVLIEIPNMHVRAHKSVLFARSKTLARMLEDGKSFIQLSCTPSCLYCALYYIYSGSFVFLAKNAVFSIGLYELACELSLLKLRDLLAPFTNEIKSQIVIDKCDIECVLQEFFTTNISTEKVESETCFDANTGIGIKIFFQEITTSDYLMCHVEVSGILEAIDFPFELYILNRLCEPLEMIPGMFMENSDIVYKNFVFTVCFSMSDIRKCCSSDGNLHLKFVGKRYLLRHLSVAYSNSIEPSSVCNDNKSWLEELSTDLQMLLRTGYLSDITLTSLHKHAFKLHRTILGARSTYFETLFLYDQHKNKVFNIPNVNTHILHWMFTYIYSGTLNAASNFTKQDCLDLFVTAEEYEIKSLSKKCIAYLSLNLDPSFVFDVLTVAEEFQHSELRSICEAYIEEESLEAEELNSSEEYDEEELY